MEPSSSVSEKHNTYNKRAVFFRTFSTSCDDLYRELALCLHLFVKAFIILSSLCLTASSSFRRFLHGGLRGLPVCNDRKTALWYYS